MYVCVRVCDDDDDDADDDDADDDNDDDDDDKQNKILKGQIWMIPIIMFLLFYI